MPVQLNDNAKKLLKELIEQDALKSLPRDRFDRVIQKPASASKDNSSAVTSYKTCADQCHMGFILQNNLLEKFKEFIASKQASDRIIDPNEKAFNEDLYNEDMSLHAAKLDAEQTWLKNAKEHSGLFSFNDVTHHARVFQSLRTNSPSRTDEKYLEPLIVTLTCSGTDCLKRFTELDNTRKEIIEKHRKAQLVEWHAKRDLDISESDFKCLKQLFRLGQLNLESVPTEIIKKNCCMSWCRDNLRDALLNFDSVKAYNADESRFSETIKCAMEEFETTAFVDDDGYKMSSLITMLNEFINREKINSALAEV